MSTGSRIHDPAAQLERTALSWQRASLAMIANGGLLIRMGLSRDAAPLVVAGALVAFVGVVLWVVASGRYAGRAGRAATNVIIGRPRTSGVLACMVTVISLTDLAAIALS